MVGYVETEGELRDNLLYQRDQFPDAETQVPDSEVASIASWAWQKRLEGKLYAGRDSEFRIHRLALDRLKGNSDALALWVVLQAQHGHKPSRTFALNQEAMTTAGHTDLSRRRFRAAVDWMIDCEVLEVALRHSQGRRSRQYRLRRAFDTGAPNVETLRSP